MLYAIYYYVEKKKNSQTIPIGMVFRLRNCLTILLTRAKVFTLHTSEDAHRRSSFTFRLENYDMCDGKCAFTRSGNEKNKNQRNTLQFKQRKFESLRRKKYASRTDCGIFKATTICHRKSIATESRLAPRTSFTIFNGSVNPRHK